ncbi:LysR family transcriptional regulator [Sphingobium lactosutens]|uniref:LysR family transcriptional regulator n=1 Tax=Sphingobium lactosutens DS20 TaxID=1331060 RepID=T0HJD0_9SPHN|nr:LysR substrate-binding domain-containing protein [Sphingobium lactosutens]EQB12253.1 LysR family transcriptional regulator [Sphingobium lactosutens DS20]
MIELRQLRYLVAAAEAGSFSRAARNLNIKQPTLSRYILETEKRLGMVLFDRKTRGATLTANGATYLRVAKRIMKEWDELDAWVSATTNGYAGKLAVGFYTSLSAGNLRATLSEFGERHRDVKLRGFERDRDMLLAGIENGLLDIAIMIGDTPYPGLMSRSFWSERVLVAMPESHSLATRERIHWTDLTGERFLLTERDPGPETRNMLLGKLGMPGYSPEIDMDDIRRDTALSVIALGGHISIVAESALGIHVPGVVFREVHETNGHTRIGFSGYWREDNENPVLRRFLAFVTARYSMPSVPVPQPLSQQAGKEPS